MTKARFLLYLHIAATVIFGIIWVVAIPTGWIKSVTFVSHISMATAMYTAFAAVMGSLTHVKQDES